MAYPFFNVYILDEKPKVRFKTCQDEFSLYSLENLTYRRLTATMRVHRGSIRRDYPMPKAPMMSEMATLTDVVVSTAEIAPSITVTVASQR